MNANETPRSDVVLSVEDLRTHFVADDGKSLPAVNGVSFVIGRGRTLALVGESGCGKSVTSFSILRLIQRPGRIVGGHVRLRSAREGEIDITSLPENSPVLRHVRGGLVSMIFQEPMTALSPVHTVGSQIAEVILLHRGGTKEEARRQGVDMLRKVGIAAPERRFDQYPHEMSGGMRQRVMIAMALVCRPELLIADEPTTALDVTIQAQILGLIRSLQREIGCSVLLITHDLGVVAQAADDVAVMYLGRIVEHGRVRDVLKRPLHPYTQGLLNSIPSLAAARLESIPGTVPALTAVPRGCPFHPRCAHARAGLCDVGEAPPLRELESGHQTACLRAEEVFAAGAKEVAHA
jgi:oligopeptide/dipeptide ABC transporter ATP-binding protein